ncbi:MAG TPA: nickel-dependent hydrogenase large subunit [Terriglobales bacterium]|nr:nickel-dependent hydrogenase large subunit [Terriglobales bacterium]
MTKRITVDPISRIEGHLRIDVEVDNGAVNQAWASATMWRGIETILQGRDPREAWLFTQRFCGVCTTVHAMASVRAVEDSLKLEIPLNAQYIRNLILISHAMHDHIVHFYHLSALDWVDVMQIPKADPAKTAALAESLSEWPRNSKMEFKAAKEKVLAVAASGQLGILANGYWGHPAMKLSPEVNLLAFTHYLQALEYQRKATQVCAMLGSKTPHIQNLEVGGVNNAINFDSEGTLSLDRLGMIKNLLDQVVAFIQQVYVPDVTAIAGMYADWFKYGTGVTNYLAVPDLPLDSKGTQFDLPGGFIEGGNLAGVRKFSTAADQSFRDAVTEDTTHAYYNNSKPVLAPWKGETNPQYTDWNADAKYTWVKGPRFEGKPAQVGPLSQVLVGYASGHPLTVKWTNAALDKISTVAGRKVAPTELLGSLGRHGARCVRAAMLSELATKHWTLLVENIGKGDVTIFNPPVFPKGTIEGVGTHEAPRGTLSHWIVVKDGKIDNYQAVVPTTWNASPRDEHGNPGPYEASLLKNPIADPERPLEVLRTVHSFDPCMACAVHTFDPEGKNIAKVKVL